MRVVGADAKGDGGPGVPRNRGAETLVELREILMGHHEPKPVLSRFGEELGEGLGDEGCELIHHE